MTEKLLQFIWQFQYINKKHLATTEGELIEVVHPGMLNTNQGPDFLNARIRLGTTLLAGSVELHLKTSEWQKHGHQQDKNYDNVILHVVLQHDISHSDLPVLELQPYIPMMLLQQYQLLMQNDNFIPCAGSIAQTKSLTLQSWKDRLVAERMARKGERVIKMLADTGNHWEESFWRLLARNFGGKVNGDAFEEIATRLPITILAKNKASIHALEALLFGIAGLLDADFNDDYPKLLQREFKFLKVKYGLHPSPIRVHFLRMRPGNFPTIRLAQLAMLVYQSNHLFSKVLEAEDVKEVKRWLAITANDYWHYHYRFDEAANYKPKKLGSSTIDSIIINTIAPVLFAYGIYHKNEVQKQKALHWLQQTAAEENNITKGFQNLSLEHKTAYDSQAFIELKNEYCNNKRCLECAVGNALLRNSRA